MIHGRSRLTTISDLCFCLQGKIALVTGGDSGIGRAVGVHFAVEGATVAFTYVPGVEEKDAEDTIHLLKEYKTPAAQDPLKIATDLGFDENCKKVCATTDLIRTFVSPRSQSPSAKYKFS